jgi:hypothetical protein
MGVYLLLGKASPSPKTPEEQEEERLGIQRGVREATASIKSEDVPIAEIMREWFPGLDEEYWGTLLNPIKYTAQEVKDYVAHYRETVTDWEGIEDYLAGIEHEAEHGDPQEWRLRSYYRSVLLARLECENFPSQESSQTQLKKAEDEMRSFVEELLFFLRQSYWKKIITAADEELGRPDPAIQTIRSLTLGQEVNGEGTWRRDPPIEEAIREFGEITEEDYDFLDSHPVPSTFFIRHGEEQLKERGVNLLSEEGRTEAAQIYREFRAEQDAYVDRFRNRRLRDRLAAKRARLGVSSPVAAAEELSEAATIRGERFEQHVANVLSAEWPELECQHLGKVKQTERGIDLLFVGPNGERVGVQCKQHADSREPSYQEWQSFLGGCTFHEIPEGSRVFVTTGTISVRQRQEAKKLGIVVFYKDELAEMASEHGIEPWS